MTQKFLTEHLTTEERTERTVAAITNFKDDVDEALRSLRISLGILGYNSTTIIELTKEALEEARITIK